jgi:hypothetical protein
MTDAARLRQIEEGLYEYRKQIAEWAKEDVEHLRAEFTEARILRLCSTKPAKLDDLQQARRIQSDIFKLLFCSHDTPLDTATSRVEKPKKGWNRKYIVGSGRAAYFSGYYLTTTAKRAKLELLSEDLGERICQLEAEERQAAEAMARSKKASIQFAGVAEDEDLAGALWHAIESTPPTVGFVYLKRWTMPDGSCWFKVGITNNPDRRETEQNVLPVAAETIACVDVCSMDRARTIEAIIHQVLEEQRITDANNRELFHLNDQQASAVKAVLERLK